MDKDYAGGDVTVLAATDPIPTLEPEGALPTWVDYQAIATDLADDGVSAPEDLVPGLQGVVEDAREHGIDLKIVYTEAPAAVYTQARDLAATLAQREHGTILVRTPAFVGAVSDESIPRARLEAGQDDAYREPDPVVSATVFEHKLLAPAPPWGAYLTVFLLVTVLAVAGFVWMIRRRRG